MENLRKQLKRSEQQRKVAWAKYFASEDENHAQYIIFKNKIDALQNQTDIPIHILNELNNLYGELSKKVECPICYEELDKFKLSNCGHKYCEACLEKLKETSNKCCICRKQLVWKTKY